MFRKLLSVLVITTAMTVGFSSAYAQGPDTDVDWSVGNPGIFCMVEKVDVCIIAQTEQDCTKLGGVKLDSCPADDKKEK